MTRKLPGYSIADARYDAQERRPTVRPTDEILERRSDYLKYISRVDSDSDYCAGWVDALSWALGKEYGTPRQRPDDQ